MFYGKIQPSSGSEQLVIGSRASLSSVAEPDFSVLKSITGPCSIRAEVMKVIYIFTTSARGSLETALIGKFSWWAVLMVVAAAVQRSTSLWLRTGSGLSGCRGQ